MLVKITSGPRRYVQLVESYRDETGRVKKRTVVTLGRLDQLTGPLDAVIAGLKLFKIKPGYCVTSRFDMIAYCIAYYLIEHRCRTAREPTRG